MQIFDFITDDWKKIPQNIRYFFMAGTTFIFVSWLVDHWGGVEVKRFWGLEISDIAFSLGSTLILIGLAFLLVKQFYIFIIVTKYRRGFPIDELNSKFYLVWFNGKLILFDKEKTEYHHIYPFQTAQDLLFIGTGTYVESNFENTNTVKISENISIQVKDYADGGAINTRG